MPPNPRRLAGAYRAFPNRLDSRSRKHHGAIRSPLPLLTSGRTECPLRKRYRVGKLHRRRPGGFRQPRRWSGWPYSSHFFYDRNETPSSPNDNEACLKAPWPSATTETTTRVARRWRPLLRARRMWTRMRELRRRLTGLPGTKIGERALPCPLAECTNTNRERSSSMRDGALGTSSYFPPTARSFA